MRTRGYADADDGIRTTSNMCPPPPPPTMVMGHNEFILMCFVFLKGSSFKNHSENKHIFKETRIPQKASSHLLGQKSQEPQSERGY